MRATIKTIYHTQLELLKALKKPFTVIEHSTLNEKFSVFSNEPLPANVYPELSYLAIGRGGHRGRLTSDGSTVIDVLQHNIKHASLYEHIPFIMRPINEDLTAGERDKYGMRTLIERNGTLYFAYYLKAVDFTTSFPVIKELTASDGELTSEDYVPTPAQLNPAPIPYSNSDVNISTGKHISVESTIEVTLDENDISEIINAIEILYGDVIYATISEIAVVTAIRQSVNTTLGGVNINYDEALAAQIANHIPANIDLRYNTKAIKQIYSLGHIAPYIT
jgi:hypothetical protein